MRFMILMFPKSYDSVKPGTRPAPAMMAYNTELKKAGVLLALDGLHSPARGARVRFAGGKATVTDGPFAEAKEVVGGYWMIQAKSKAEAVEWFRRCPGAPGDVIEIRQIFEMTDFPEDVQKAAAL
jgi:hypothetical protein